MTDEPHTVKFEGISYDDLDEALQSLVDRGLVSRQWSRDRNDFVYKVTDAGRIVAEGEKNE